MLRPVLCRYPLPGRLMPRAALIHAPWEVSTRVRLCRDTSGQLHVRETRRGLAYLAPDGSEVYPVSARVLAAAAVGPGAAEALARELDCQASRGDDMVSFRCRGFPGFRLGFTVGWYSRWGPAGLAAPAAGDEDLLAALPELELWSRETAEQLSDATLRLHSRFGGEPVRGAWTVTSFTIEEPGSATMPIPASAPGAARLAAGRGAAGVWESSPRGAFPLKAVAGVRAGVGVPAVARIHVDPWLLARLAGSDTVDLEGLVALLESAPEVAVERLLMPTPPPETVRLRGPGLRVRARRLPPARGRIYAVAAGSAGYVEVPGPAELTVYEATRRGGETTAMLARLLVGIMEA